MMETIRITQGQSSNACTLISIGVINTILQFDETNRTNQLQTLIAQTQQNLIRDYDRDLENDPELGQGYLETDARNRYFANSLNISTRQEINLKIHSATNETIVREFIDNRNSFTQEDEFYTYNNDSILAIFLKLRENEGPPNWWMVTEDELLKKLRPEEQTQEDAIQPIQQLITLFDDLKNQGMTLNSDGHTLSLTKKNGTFYLYDSESGNLSRTNSSQELADYLVNNKYAQANSISIYTLTPTPALPHQHTAVPASTHDAQAVNLGSLKEVIEKYKTQLHNKRKYLNQHGHRDAANALDNYLTPIETAYLGADEDPQVAYNSLIETLKNAQEDGVLSTHRGYKNIITNFLIALTGVGLIALHCTSQSRGSFWYKTNTDTINQVESFQDELNKLDKP
ncbi:MAG: hypothetical protein P1U39_05280 [Legionellaceae bacterium]|nr:hypothetical protein [Legionellaceae bacterium]